MVPQQEQEAVKQQEEEEEQEDQTPAPQQRAAGPLPKAPTTLTRHQPPSRLARVLARDGYDPEYAQEIADLVEHSKEKREMDIARDSTGLPRAPMMGGGGISAGRRPMHDMAEDLDLARKFANAEGGGGGGGQNQMMYMFPIMMSNMMQQQMQQQMAMLEQHRNQQNKQPDIMDKMEALVSETMVARMMGDMMGGENKKVQELERQLAMLMNEKERKEYELKLDAARKEWEQKFEELKKAQGGGSVPMAGGQPGDPLTAIQSFMTDMQTRWEQSNKVRSMLGLPQIDIKKIMDAHQAPGAMPPEEMAKMLEERYGAKVEMPPRSWADVQKHMDEKMAEITKKAEKDASDKFELHKQRKEMFQMAFDLTGSLVENFLSMVSQGKGNQSAEKIRQVMSGVRKTSKDAMGAMDKDPNSPWKRGNNMGGNNNEGDIGPGTGTTAGGGGRDVGQ